MLTLQRDTDLTLTDGTFRIVDRIGNQIHLQNLANGQYSTTHIGDLLPRLSALPAAPSVSPRVLDHLSEEDRNQVTMWKTHIEEMVSGDHPNFDTPRPQYDPKTTTLNERMAAKITELKGFGIKTSRSSLFEKKKAYETSGAAALLDRRKHKQVGKLDKADEKLIATISSVVAHRTLKSTVTESELHRLVNAEMTIRYQDDAPKPCSRATMYRYFNTMYGGNATAKATTRRSRAGTPNRTYGTSRRMLPGQEVQIDSTTLNVTVKTKSGPQRPLLTMMLDVATRSVLAFSLRLEGTKGYDHALLLAQTLVPFSQRPDLTEHRALVAALRPDFPLLSTQERARLQAAHPVITPRYFITDNGKDYLSDVFRSACAKFNVDIVRSAIHTPTDKPFVERNFGSANNLFLQSLPGYVGTDTGNRGLHPEKEDLLDLGTLTELMDDWILSVWQYRKHAGLRDPFDPSETYSPNQWFNACADLAGDIELPLSADDYIDLMPSTTRVIGTTGVQYLNRRYDSVELHPYRGRPSNRPHLGNEWEVKYNPRDVTRVWVRSPENRWIECRWREADSIYQPHFADISQKLRKTEANKAADASARRGGAILPDPVLEPTPVVSNHAWDPTKIAELSMFEVEDEEKK